MNVYVNLAEELKKWRKPSEDAMVPTLKNVVEIGADERVEIDKIYGPLIAFPIRVHVDIETAEWVVEREFIPQDKDGNDLESDWRVMARFPCQTEDDFPEAPLEDRG